MLYEMRLIGLAMDPFNNAPIVILKDRASLEREDTSEEEIREVILASAKRAEAQATAQVEDIENVEEDLPTDQHDLDMASVQTNENAEKGADAAAIDAEASVPQEPLIEREGQTDTAPEGSLPQGTESAFSDLNTHEMPSPSWSTPHSSMHGGDVSPPSEGHQEHILPIWIGESEAHAIATVLLGIESPRPMTHDLLKQVIVSFGGQVQRIVVTDLRDNTFYANIEVALESGDILTLDARPSDAIALALRCEADIYVDSRVLERTKHSAATPKVKEEDLEDLDQEQWKKLVESRAADSTKKYTQ